MKLRESFNKVAKKYNEARPKYPDEVIDWIIKESKINTGHSLLEIAPGTGQATIKFAKLGYKIHAVELGDKLAKILSKNCREYDVNVDVSSFEDWKSKEKHDLIYCATAFHWIDPEIKYKKCYDLLKEKSKLVLIWHLASGVMNPIVEKAYDALWSYYPNKSKKNTSGISLQDRRKNEVNESGYFELANYYEHKWMCPQNKEDFIKGFQTQSAYISLESDKKLELDNNLQMIINNFDETIHTEFLTCVYVCRKVNNL